MSWKKNLEDGRDQFAERKWRGIKHTGKGGDHEVVYTCSFKVGQVVTQ